MPRKSGKKNSKPKQVPRAPRKASRAPAGVSAAEAHANAYVSLLRDPCGSRMVRPTYEGAGGSYLVRTRTMTQVPSGAADSLYQFSPCYGFNAIGLSNAVTSGGGLITFITQPFPSFLSSSTIGSFRCVAACVRTHYTGTELNRKGLVGCSLVNGPQLNAGAAPVGTISGYLAASQRVVRLGEEIHECRWVPSSGDSHFFANNDPVGTYTGDFTGNAIIIAVQDHHIGTLSFELNAVWEWVPNMNTGTGLPNTVNTPTSAATLNSTLTKIRDVVAFATHPDTVNSAKSVMQGMQRMGIGRSAMRMMEF